MAEATTYATLVADIEEYAERHDEPFLAQIPRFVALCEQRLAMEDKPLGFLRVVGGTLNGASMVKPTRWRKTRSFSILVGSERSYLQLRPYEYCRTYWPDASQQDQPLYYADYDYEHFFLAPTPDATYSFELAYYERPDPLSEENQTNWTTRYAPQLLLYGSLLEAMPFLKNSERIAEFQGMYDRALQALVKEDSSRIQDASS